MIEYKDILTRVLDNLNEEMENTKKIKSIKRDIEDSMVELFTNSEAPITSKSYLLVEDCR